MKTSLFESNEVIYTPDQFMQFERTTSSKGNQRKFINKNEVVKLDDLGYEGLSEVLAYRLAKAIGISAIEYTPCKMQLGTQLVTGCVSPNFLQKDEVELNLGRLLCKFYGVSSHVDLYEKFDALSALSDRIKFVSAAVSDELTTESFYSFLSDLLLLDSLTLNEDRHLFNIVLKRNISTGVITPIVFDNGAAFFSDISLDYPMSMPVHVAMRKVKAKPFSTKFDKQLSEILSFSNKQYNIPDTIYLETSDLKSYYEEKYIDRALSVIRLTSKRTIDNPPKQHTHSNYFERESD